jgi:hypothetical protein
MVEKLYGVEHGPVRIWRAPYFAELVPTHPSKELIRDLSSLPDGTSVGIELYQELAEAILSHDEEESTYMREILEVCHPRLQVIFLDDQDLCERTDKKRSDATFMRNISSALLRKIDSERNSQNTSHYQETMRLIRQSEYRAEVEADYLEIVEREQKMIEKILKHNPQVVILGNNHGDFFIAEAQELFEKHGVSIIQYYRETIDLPLQPTRRNIEGLTAYLVRKPPDQRVALERELIKRRYYAATQRRILPEKSPDFIGTWNTKIRPAGLFEIYLTRQEGNSFWGTIEDVYGTARCRGVLEGENIEFLKSYDPEKSRDQAQGGIFYVCNSLSDNVANLFALWEAMPPALIDSAFDSQQEFDLWKLIPDAPITWRPFLIYQGDKFNTK